MKWTHSKCRSWGSEWWHISCWIWIPQQPPRKLLGRKLLFYWCLWIWFIHSKMGRKTVRFVVICEVLDYNWMTSNRLLEIKNRSAPPILYTELNSAHQQGAITRLTGSPVVAPIYSPLFAPRFISPLFRQSRLAYPGTYRWIIISPNNKVFLQKRRQRSSFIQRHSQQYSLHVAKIQRGKYSEWFCPFGSSACNGIANQQQCSDEHPEMCTFSTFTLCFTV